MGWDGLQRGHGPGESGSLPEIRTNDSLGLEWVGIISPQMVVNARVSFARYLGEDRGDANAGFDLTKLGFPSSLVSSLPGGAFFGTYSFPNYFNLGQYPTGDITNTGSAAASLSWNVKKPFRQIRRRHARHSVHHAKLQHRSQPERRSGVDAAELCAGGPAQRQ